MIECAQHQADCKLFTFKAHKVWSQNNLSISDVLSSDRTVGNEVVFHIVDEILHSRPTNTTLN